MIKKIKKDPIYSKMLQKYNVSKEDIVLAGFFEDNHTEDTFVEEYDTLDIQCTPYNFLNTDLLKNSVNPVVLLTTGSFNPIHSGHIKMMELAKKAMEEKGFAVVGGYFAPDHDEYINMKLGDEAIPFNYRMKFILDMLKESKIDWLTVDPWAGIFEPVAVNFTRIIERLRLYLYEYLGRPVDVVYVCGSDNARFARIADKHSECVVVNRTSEIGHNRYLIEDNQYITYIEEGEEMSSTKVRESFSYKKLLDTITLRVYRDPRSFALINLFQEYFKEVKFNFVADNEDKLMAMLVNDKNMKNVISIDSDTQLKYNLHICRNYDAFGIKSNGWTNRPGFQSIDAQIDKLPVFFGPCFLFDDDIFTGGTMKFVTEKLIQARKVNRPPGQLSIVNSQKTEIADLKDFFYDLHADSNNFCANGLVVNNVRQPYIYPYVSPFIRCSISDPLSFSIAVWKINMDYFQQKNDIKSFSICSKHYYSLQKLQKQTCK